MSGNEFLTALTKTDNPNPEGNVFSGIWSSYERVILHSLITSFGLDFLVQDQPGGDVDTIRSVRDERIPVEERYKNSAHLDAYENRGAYDTKAYHSGSRFRAVKKNARDHFNATGEKIPDGYVPGHFLVPNKSSAVGTGDMANLDHVISAYEIHEDGGRVLAGLNGLDLANAPENLVFTNERLNKSMGATPIGEYVEQAGDSLPEATKEKMVEVDRTVRQRYDAILNHAYYTSSDFWTDTATAASKRGVEMGIRQALGFVFVEIWFACKGELRALPADAEISDYIQAIVRGIKNSAVSVAEKWKGLLESFGAGFMAGALASLTTTLCNIFFAVDEHTIRNLRHAYAAIVQAGNVLLFNPNNLKLGDRIETATVILASGASVLVGAQVGDAVGKTPLGADATVGLYVRGFCSTLVSGLISCTFLLFLDHSKLIRNTILSLNQYLTEDQGIAQIAVDFEKYAAHIADIDLDGFHKETDFYRNVADEIIYADDDDEIHAVLTQAYAELDIPMPWTGDFDEFMGNRNNKLIFGRRTET